MIKQLNVNTIQNHKVFDFIQDLVNFHKVFFEIERRKNRFKL